MAVRPVCMRSGWRHRATSSTWWIRWDGFPAIVAQDVRTGVHVNPAAHPGWFTTAYFHTPDELVEEVTSVGFEADGPVAVEGPWPVHESLLDGGAKQEVALAAIRRLEREPSVLGASAHLLVAGRKPC